MDRGYESYNLMAHFEEKGGKYIIRVKSGKKSFASRFHLPDVPIEEEVTIKLSKNQTNKMKYLYKLNPENYRFVPNNSRFDFLPDSVDYGGNPQFYELDFRILKIPIGEGNYEVLVTNSDLPFEDIKKLYTRRWGIETSFRDLKYSIGLVNFHAKKKEGGLQEIYARFTEFNFCRWITMKISDTMSSLENYQICFSDAVYACKQFLKNKLTSSQLKTYIERHLSIIRPGRTFKRRLRNQSVVSFTYRVS